MSIGVQSLRDDDLRYLGREHTARDAREALATATDMFGENVSFDLIYGRYHTFNISHCFGEQCTRRLTQ